MTVIRAAAFSTEDDSDGSDEVAVERQSNAPNHLHKLNDNAERIMANAPQLQ